MSFSLLPSLAQSALTLGQTTAAIPRPPYRPFIDPLELHQWWFLMLIPMSLGVAMVYRAVRLPTLEKYWTSVMVMTLQIIGGMLLLAAASYWLVMIFARFIAERAL